MSNQQTLQNSLDPEKKYILQDVMKKRKRNLDSLENKIRNKLTVQANKKKNNKDIVKRPQKFVKRYRASQKSFSDLKRRTVKVLGDQPIVEKEKLLVVVRIRGINDISNVQKRILYTLNLREVNSAVFMRMNKKNLIKLKRVENYITYGFPSRKLIEELIYKKLCVKVNGERKLINTNQLVEQNFGGKLICLEDIINELLTLGPEFDKINEFIWPFKLTTKTDMIPSHLRKPFNQGGEWGYREQLINEFIMKMI